jgi:hypothetical protein
MDQVLKNSDDLQLTQVYRDGLCHQSVMWFVHHLSAADQAEVSVNTAGTAIPPKPACHRIRLTHQSSLCPPLCLPR